MTHAIDPDAKPRLGVQCTCGKKFPVPTAIEKHIEDENNKENEVMEDEVPPQYRDIEERVAEATHRPQDAAKAASKAIAQVAPKEKPEPAPEQPKSLASVAENPGNLPLDLKNMTLNQINFIGKTMAASGMFTDVKDAATAIVKILAGQEIGVTPFQAMTNIHIIQNKATMSANLMAAKVKGSGKYDYRVVKQSAEECEIDFYQLDTAGKRDKIGTSSFTIAEAKAAGTQNLAKYPRNMLFARAMSNGTKWYTPDVFNGNLVYLPEELGANVDQDGEVVHD